MSQVVAMAVPFLLILLALPSAPYIERIIDTHVVVRSTTTTLPHTWATTTTTRAQESAPPSVSATPSTTTTTEPPSHKRIVKSATPSVSTTTTTAPSPEPSGELTETNAQVDVPVDAGTNWVLEASGTVGWTLLCGSTTTEPGPNGLQVPPDESGCVIDLQLEQTAPVTWQLDEY
jgi:hypothetical protein